MVHLSMLLWIVSLILSFSCVTLFLVIWLKYRNANGKDYFLFLSFLAGNTAICCMSTYIGINIAAADRVYFDFANYVFIYGIVYYMIVFMTRLLDPQRLRFIVTLLRGSLGSAVVVQLFFYSNRLNFYPVYQVVILSFYASALYYFFRFAAHFNRIAPSTKRMFMIFFSLFFCFFPLLILDAIRPPFMKALYDTGFIFYVPFTIFVNACSLAAAFLILTRNGLPFRKTTISEHFLKTYFITSREKEVIEALLLGLSNKQISDKYFVSIGTTKTHLNNIYRKTETKNRLALTKLIERS